MECKMLYGLGALALIVLAPLTCAPAAACPQTQVAEADPAPLLAAPAQAELKFDWPVRGRIVIQCWTEDMDTIAIAAEDGTTVQAAQSGAIAYARALKGYGDVVMIRHAGGFVSATYGDIGDLRVKRGDRIERGQPIAVIRSAQDFPGIGIKFELRQGAKAVDARHYMSTPEPKREPVADLLSEE